MAVPKKKRYAGASPLLQQPQVSLHKSNLPLAAPRASHTPSLPAILAPLSLRPFDFFTDPCLEELDEEFSGLDTRSTTTDSSLPQDPLGSGSAPFDDELQESEEGEEGLVRYPDEENDKGSALLEDAYLDPQESNKSSLPPLSSSGSLLRPLALLNHLVGFLPVGRKGKVVNGALPYRPEPFIHEKMLSLWWHSLSFTAAGDQTPGYPGAVPRAG